MPYVRFLFISLVWGSSFILMKKGGVCFSPTAIGAWRVIGGAALLALVWRKAAQPRRLVRRDAAVLAFVVLFGFAWPFSAQPYLIGRDGSAFIGMMVSFTPLLTIGVSIPLLRIYPTRQQLLGVLGALGFMALLMVDGRRRQIPFLDLALALTVPLCYALTNTLIRRSLAHVSSLELSLTSLAATGMLLLPISLAGASVRPPPAAGQIGVAIASVAFLGFVGTGIGTFVFNRLVQEQGPLFAGMVTNLVPIGALVWGWLDAEPVTGLQLVALAGLVSMVAVVQLGGTRPPSRET